MRARLLLFGKGTSVAAHNFGAMEKYYFLVARLPCQSSIQTATFSTHPKMGAERFFDPENSELVGSETSACPFLSQSPSHHRSRATSQNLQHRSASSGLIADTYTRCVIGTVLLINAESLMSRPRPNQHPPNGNRPGPLTERDSLASRCTSCSW